jgi:hypothetical protein
MWTPGYYKTITRAATVREMVRMRGVLMLPLTFILMKFVVRPSGGVWMPSLCAETDCRADELSPQFWRATETQRAAFERLGFAPCFHSKLRRNLNPMYLGDGAITYLHSGQSHVGTLVYGRIQAPAPLNQVRETVVVGFTAALEGGSVSFTNSKDHFDPLPGRQAVLVGSADPAPIYDQFVSHLRSRAQMPRVFAGCAPVRQWLDECRLESFEARVARGLYVRMSDDEVEEARRNMGGGQG